MTNDPLEIQARLRALGLYGLADRYSEFADCSWLLPMIEVEEQERKKRSLQRRLRAAKLGLFKPMADFDWGWPKGIERDSVRDALALGFLSTSSNVLILGPNGVGKTMMLKNIVHGAVMAGHDALVTTASDMLADLGSRDNQHLLHLRMAKYCRPTVLGIDEVGYLSYDQRYADLLFQLVSLRYEQQKPIVLTTNKPLEDWATIFPHAACVVTLIDRLVHRCELLEVAGESYRLKEASERTKARSHRHKHSHG
jgi:DNA replication protein DnaC